MPTPVAAGRRKREVAGHDPTVAANKQMRPSVHFRQTGKPTEKHRAERPFDRSTKRAGIESPPASPRPRPGKSDANRRPAPTVRQRHALPVLGDCAGMFASAWLNALAEARESVYAAAFIQVHRSSGAPIWIATAFRLFWRLTNAELPPFPVDITKVHRAIVQMSEYILYALLLVQQRRAWGWRSLTGVPSRSSCGVSHNCCLKTRQCQPRFIRPMKSVRGRSRHWPRLMPPPPCFTTSSFATTCFTAWRP